MDTPRNPYDFLPVVSGHPACLHIYQFFDYRHLSVVLAQVSEPFADLAARLITRAGQSPETSVALRYLLEAKDAAVRAALDQDRQESPPIEVPASYGDDDDTVEHSGDDNHDIEDKG